MTNETRVCHICKNTLGLRGICPTCTEWVETLPDPATMTPDERVAEFDLWDGPLEIEFNKMYARLKALAGRRLQTIELANRDAIRELIRNRKMAS